MKIFRVEPDVARFQWLITEPESVYSSGLLRFDCTPKRPQWVSPSVYVHNPKDSLGDFFRFVPAALVCGSRAVEILRGPLERAGEILPLTVEKQVLHLMNVLECVNCLDETRSDLSYNAAEKLYSFLPKRLTGSSLFKIPQTANREILTFEGRDGNDPEDEFKYLVDTNKLTGLVFELLWEGDG